MNDQLYLFQCPMCGLVWKQQLFADDIECPKCGLSDDEPVFFFDDLYLDLITGKRIDTNHTEVIK